MIHITLRQNVMGTAYQKLPHKIIGQLLDNEHEKHVVVTLDFAPIAMTPAVHKHMDEYVSWFRDIGIRVDIFTRLHPQS